MFYRSPLALLCALIVLLGVLIYRFWGASSQAGSPGPSATSSKVSNAGNGDRAGAPAVSSALTAALSGPAMRPMPDEELQRVNLMEPQEQAEALMTDAMKHFEGATDLIMARVGGWRGKISMTSNWMAIDLQARYSSDLRVRDADAEVNLVASGVDKDPSAVQPLVDDIATYGESHAFDFYLLGMLAYRGVETERIRSLLQSWSHDLNEKTRFWAVEGLALVGTDETIDDFLGALRSDPSMDVRQRCGASLAKSGMFTREQRMKAVPGLIDIAADPAEDSSTRGWAFQALHEITTESIGSDAAAWRSWFGAHGSERSEQFHAMNKNWILGNS